MRVILFQDRFAELVRMGVKCQTIRKTARCRLGDILSLRRWTGRPRRSKQEILRTAVCTGVGLIVIDRGFAIPNLEDAIADGFANQYEMLEWFAKTHGLPFHGWLIKWEDGK